MCLISQLVYLFIYQAVISQKIESQDKVCINTNAHIHSSHLAPRAETCTPPKTAYQVSQAKVAHVKGCICNRVLGSTPATSYFISVPLAPDLIISM